MNPIYIENYKVIYNGVTYTEDQWEVKLKEIKDTRINNLTKQNDNRSNQTLR